MKTAMVLKVLVFIALGGLFIANTSFIEDNTGGVIPLSTGMIPHDAVAVTKATDTVIIKNMVFNPRELHVQKGGTVLWINQDIVPHNVTEGSTTKWTSGTIERGHSWTKKIDASFDYYCSIHVTMKGKIIVDP